MPRLLAGRMATFHAKKSHLSAHDTGRQEAAHYQRPYVEATNASENGGRNSRALPTLAACASVGWVFSNRVS